MLRKEIKGGLKSLVIANTRDGAKSLISNVSKLGNICIVIQITEYYKFVGINQKFFFPTVRAHSDNFHINCNYRGTSLTLKNSNCSGELFTITSRTHGN